MILPKNLEGPQISEGDIVSFSFDESHLTFFLPVIPKNWGNQIKGMHDEVSTEKNFINAKLDQWNDGFGYKTKGIVDQSWKYNDKTTYDNVAGCDLEIDVLYHTDELNVGNKLLSPSKLRDFYIEEMIKDYEDSPETRPGWPCAENNFFAEKIDNDNMIGVKMLVKLGADAHPCPLAYLSLGKYYSVAISLQLGKINYGDGRPNPFTDDELFQLKKDIFEDFLLHVKIEYAPETKKIIDKLRTE